VSGRLSYTFAMRGPAISVDTACSSSLVAMHAAVNSLALRQAAAAAVAGVNLTLAPETPAMFLKAGMLSLEGRCKALDAAADGYARAGEWSRARMGVEGAGTRAGRIDG
jgi:acyl transferase domain-containing protein